MLALNNVNFIIYFKAKIKLKPKNSTVKNEMKTGEGKVSWQRLWELLGARGVHRRQSVSKRRGAAEGDGETDGVSQRQMFGGFKE